MNLNKSKQSYIGGIRRTKWEWEMIEYYNSKNKLSNSKNELSIV